MEDLFDFTNYREHPSQRSYQVFHFKRADQAGFFENLLVEHKIEFERHDDESETGTVHYFGIHKSDMEQAKKLNNLTIGQYREKFIANSGFRWIVMVIGLSALVLAISGYLMSR